MGFQKNRLFFIGDFLTNPYLIKYTLTLKVFIFGVARIVFESRVFMWKKIFLSLSFCLLGSLESSWSQSSYHSSTFAYAAEKVVKKLKKQLPFSIYWTQCWKLSFQAFKKSKSNKIQMRKGTKTSLYKGIKKQKEQVNIT